MVLSGLGQGNEAKLLEEGAAAFFVKSEKSLENNSAILIQAIEKILKGTKSEGELPIHAARRLGN